MAAELDDSSRDAFAVVTQSLLKLGAMPIEKYLDLRHLSSTVSFTQNLKNETGQHLPEQREVLEPSFGPVQQIESSCKQYLGGFIMPRWFSLLEPKTEGFYGCALLIEVSLDTNISHAVDATFQSFGEARLACARLALEEDIIESLRGYSTLAITPDVNPSRPRGLFSSVQEFCDSLPHPLPKFMRGKTVAQINAPQWLNTEVQIIKGSRVQIKHLFMSEQLHGCVLLVDRKHPPLHHTYVVPPLFSKRAEAKAAAILLAISQGIDSILRSVVKEMDEKLTPGMRKITGDSVLPILGSEVLKIRRDGKGMKFDYLQDGDAHGCKLTLCIAAINPRPDEVRLYTVPPEYKSKGDAKIAVAYLAAQLGALEFVRFGGEKPPFGYQSPFDNLEIAINNAGYKRKREERNHEEGEIREDESVTGSGKKKRRKE